MNGNFHHQHNLFQQWKVQFIIIKQYPYFCIFLQLCLLWFLDYVITHNSKKQSAFVENMVHYHVQNYRSLSHRNLIHTKPLPQSSSCSKINVIVIFTFVYFCPPSLSLQVFFTYNFALSHAWYMPCPSHSHWLDIS